MDQAPARYGSDTVVDFLQHHGIGMVTFNPGASFRGIHDSLVNRDGAPRIVLTLHEGVSVALAHGYAKATGTPMAVLLHDVVGLQQASMSIFNAWCDRAPILLLGGTGPVSAVGRRPWIDWLHTALVQGNLVRDYVKWDDQPADLASVPESLLRALQTAVASPPGPTYVCLDAGMMEAPAPPSAGTPVQGPLVTPTPPAPRGRDVAWIAERVRRARHPVLVTDHAGATDAGFTLLRALAERLAAPVIDGNARLSFPTDHPLSAIGVEREVLAEADLVLALDVEDLYGVLRGPVYEEQGHGPPRARAGVQVVHCSPAHYRLRSWAHDYQRLAPLDLHVSATAETALEALTTALDGHSLDTSSPDERRRRLTAAWRARRRGWWRQAASADTADSVPGERLAAELWPLLREREWTLVAGSLGGWERKLWDFASPRQHLGWHGGGGLGYGMGAAIGAALAIGTDRLCLNLQPDGDFLFTPSALWTAARERVPLLTVMNNNRQYRNTVEHAERVARERGHPTDRRYVGAGLTDPVIDYAALARSYGVWAAGPVTAGHDVADAVAEAVAVVERGLPALVDVVTTGA